MTGIEQTRADLYRAAASVMGLCLDCGREGVGLRPHRVKPQGYPNPWCGRGGVLTEGDVAAGQQLVRGARPAPAQG